MGFSSLIMKSSATSLKQEESRTNGASSIHVKLLNLIHAEKSLLHLKRA